MRLRAVHIITQLELGGAQRNTLYTVSHLDPAYFEPILICGRGGILDKEAKAAVWPTHFVPSLVRPIRPWKDIAALIAIYRLLRQLRPHIVHTHSSKAGILGRIAAYVAGVPIVIHTFHGFGFTPGQSKIVRAAFVWAEKVCARLSTHLIFVSEENRREAAERGIGKSVPTSLIRSGIQMHVSFPSLRDADRRFLTRETPDRRVENLTVRERWKIPNEAWLVLSIGNFKPQKNPLDLVRTAAAVLAKKPDIHFLFVGEGELRPKAEALARENNIQDHIHWPGWLLRHDDIAKVLADSNCFLLTSLWEGLPRALVEASAARLPSVAYGVDGVRDILRDGETGFLIPAGQVDAAAEKILWLSDHRFEARQMGSKAHSLVIKEFDIDLMVQKQDELYKKLYEDVPLKNYYEPLWAGSTKPS